MKKILIAALFAICTFTSWTQSCNFDQQITTTDSVMCAGDSLSLSFSVNIVPAVDTVVATTIVNNNGQDGNMFDIVATNTIRIRYFEGNIANTPNASTNYSIYYKTGSHVGFETNAAAWTLLTSGLIFNPNTPNTLTTIPYNVDILIPAGETYAFYLTNTSAATNNNRYHSGTATGAVLAQNADLTILEGTGGAYPFGTFFNARPWEGIIHYDSPEASYLWNTGDTTATIEVSPASTMDYSCEVTFAGMSCVIEDTITVEVHDLPVLNIPDELTFCQGDSAMLDAENAGSAYLWSTNETSQTITASVAGEITVMVTDTNGCVSNDTTLVLVNPLPTVTFSAIADLCATGEIISLDQGSPAGGSYSGSGVAGVYFDLSVAGVGSHELIYEFADTNGCASSDTTTVLINPLPVVTFAAIGDLCVYHNAITLNQGSPSGGLYSGTGVSGTDFTPSIAGSGTHVLMYEYTDANGCEGSDTSEVFVDECLSVKENSISVLAIYPNPFKHSTTISLDQSLELNGLSFEVYDMTGKRVAALTPLNHTFEFLRGNLESGIYHYVFISNGKTLGAGKLVME